MNNSPIIVVANTGDSSISVIDSRTWEEIDRIGLVPSSGPYDLVAASTEGQVLTSNYYSDSISKIDILTGQMLGSVIIGRRPCYMSYDKERGLAFVTNSDSDSISVVDAYEMKLVSQVTVGSLPQGIDFDPFTQNLAIANINSNEVFIVDTRDFFIRGKIKMEGYPFQVKYSNNGRGLYVSCATPQNCDASSIAHMDTVDYKVIHEFKLGGMPGRLLNTKEDGYLLVASMSSGGIEIIDLKNKRLESKMAINGMTHGIAMDAEEKYVYITNPDDDSINVIDWRRADRIKTIKVGKEPNGILII
ncbi:MAG: hypothetical protein GX352_06330 [Clostridiales bacterium]|nr:hypothetical protein [Clostridiales bacterium]